MAGFMERVRRLRDDVNAIYAEAEAHYEGGRARPGGERRRGRPPGPSTRSSAAGGETSGKVTLAQLPEAIAQRYPQTGATAAEIRQLLGWKATAPIGNVERLVTQGRLIKAGDRFTAPAGMQAAA